MRHAYLAGLIVCVVVGIVFRFDHPSMTETQLLIHGWPIWAVTAAWIALGPFTAKRKSAR